MISCTCYDFSHGHLCKHTHKVRSVHYDRIGLTADTSTGCDATEPTGRCYRLSVGLYSQIIPYNHMQQKWSLYKNRCTHLLEYHQMKQVSYSVCWHTNVYVHSYNIKLIACSNFHIIHTPVLHGRRTAIVTYLQEIQMSLGNIRDEGVLDHVMAKLLPVVTSLRAQSAQPADEKHTTPASFVKTEAFTPAEKNETQWRFHKVKTAGRIKTKFPMKYDKIYVARIYSDLRHI